MLAKCFVKKYFEGKILTTTRSFMNYSLFGHLKNEKSNC
jgi:hypothetical protein